jgi:carboxypeptidase family protein
MRFGPLLLCCVALVGSACHPGPVIDAGAKQPPVGGTIAGLVTTVDKSVAVPGRKVTATEAGSGQRFDATTAENGGYTIKVPLGAYRLDVELREGETLLKRPAETRVRNSDLDSGRDFVISVKAAAPR